jgi:hypothetical protein
MDQGTLIMLAGAGIANLLIMYLIINAATKATVRSKYEWGQLQLLAKIARAQGVPEEEIANVFEVVDKK